MLKNTAVSWGSPAKLFHWVSAGLLLYLIFDGWWMTHMLARGGRFAALYVVTFGLSVVGWVMVGMGRRPIDATLFGLFPVPLWTRTPNKAWHDLLEDTHQVLAYVLLALIVVHVIAALRHHFYKKNVLSRMGWAAR